MAKLDEQIFAVMKKSGKPLTLVEIANELGKPPKSVFKALQKLFSEGKIDCDIRTRSYTLSKE